MFLRYLSFVFITDERPQLCESMETAIANMCMNNNFPKVKMNFKISKIFFKSIFQISAFAYVDARRDNISVESLRNDIINLLKVFKLRGKPLMGQKIPASYMK